MKRRFVRRRLIQTPYNSGDPRRRVREEVRPKKERPDPGRGQRRNSRKAGCELRSGNERGLRSMFIATSGNQCDCTTVLGPIRVGVNARVQLRRNAQSERPEKGRGDKSRDKSTPENLETRQAVHRGPSLRQRSTPRKQFLGSARVVVCSSWRTFPAGWGTQRIAFTPATSEGAIRSTRGACAPRP
jgi:hypothetical protein